MYITTILIVVTFLHGFNQVSCKTISSTLQLNHREAFDYFDFNLDVSEIEQLHLTPEQYSSINNININHNMLISVDADVFDLFPNLKVLNLRNNTLGKHEYRARGNAVTSLDVSENMFSEVSENFIGLFPQVLRINMAHNLLENIHLQLVDAPLLSLNLSYNGKLRNVDISSKNLEELILEGVLLKTLKLDAPGLKKLDLSGSIIIKDENNLEFEEICNLNSRRTFHIVYTDDNGRKALFNCANHNKIEIKTANNHNCNQTTRRIKVDDLVLTQKEYDSLQISLITLCTLLLVLLTLNCIFFNLYIIKTRQQFASP